MTSDPKVNIDQTHWHILRLLQENARMSLSDIGEVVGLTSIVLSTHVTRRVYDAGLVEGALEA